jgi:hypothetical protein
VTRSDPGYESAVSGVIGRIRETLPGNLVEKFADGSGLSRDSFHICSPAGGEVCAIDGSDVIVMESGSTALAVFRAAQSTFRDNERGRRSETPIAFALIGPGPENLEFPGLYRECFGSDPGKPLPNEDRSRAAGILRDTLEYWILLQMAGELPPGSLLLRDGPLRVSHASHDPVLTRTMELCRDRKIGLAGVSKRTTATWGGGHPLLPAVSGLAKFLGMRAPWWVRIDPALLDHTKQFLQWQHGQAYVACLHPHARGLLKIELPLDLPDGEVPGIMDRLASCSGDGRIPGYPYPLFDAHRAVTLTEEIIDKVRSDLMRGIAEAGIDRETYEILFGDYHDEFARY